MTSRGWDQLDPNTITVFAVLSSRWSVPVLRALGCGHARFNGLRRQLTGISHKVLIDTLRTLQREGFVQGPLTDDGGPRPSNEVVEYRLTRAGLDLLAMAGEIQRWSLSHGENLNQARQSFARRWPRTG